MIINQIIEIITLPTMRSDVASSSLATIIMLWLALGSRARISRPLPK